MFAFGSKYQNCILIWLTRASDKSACDLVLRFKFLYIKFYYEDF
jgi:hypothetical protein